MRSITAAIAAATATAIVVTSSFAIAAIPNSSTKVITGCYLKTSGTLRVIDKQANKTCKTTEIELSWNQQGLTGNSGLPGLPGAKGDPGPSTNCTGFAHPGVDWHGCDLRGSFRGDPQLALDFSGLATWQRLQLDGANLRGVDLSPNIDPQFGSYPAVFKNVSFSNTDFAGANLTGVIFDLATYLVGNNFAGANLTGVIFRGGGLLAPNFSGANLTNAHLSPVFNGNFSGANLSGAALEQLSTVNLTGANLTGATVLRPDINTGITWANTTCPDGSNSDTNPRCGF